MSRGDAERIGDILQAIERCQQYLVAVDGYEGVLLDMAEDALERNLQIIGEAANHLSGTVVGAHPDIPWAQIRGFRNILVHQYFGVDLTVVRTVVDEYLPALATALRS